MAWGTGAWGTRTWDDATGATATTTVVAAPVPAGGAYAWGTRSWSVGANIQTPFVAPVIPPFASTFIRRRVPSTAAILSFHRRRQTAFLPQYYIYAASEYLLFNIGVLLPGPAFPGDEYLYWNLGPFGTNIRDLYVPHKRWPIQPSFDTLAALQREHTPLDRFVADLYEAIGQVRARPEFINYKTMEDYSDQLRQAGVQSPSFGPLKLPLHYNEFGIRATAQSVVNQHSFVPNAQAIADHVVNISLHDHWTKTHILYDIQRWTFNAPTRLGKINARPDYLAHSITPIPYIPDDLQFILRNIRNRMALQERTNLIKVQHWTQERFPNLPGTAAEYILWNVGSNGALAGPGSGILGGGVIGQPLALRVATGRVAAAHGRRGRVFWP